MSTDLHSNRSAMATSEAVGQGAGVATSAENFADNVLFNARQGHGFAAERANDLYDRMSGRDARIVGGDNAKDGVDRLVDGVQIQTKYYQSSEASIDACFHEGRFRYVDSAGRPMQIEVPSDQYLDAIERMKGRIEAGEVPGVTDPRQAENIVRRGHFTYKQACNVAKAGTIEGLTYDAVNGIKVAGWAGGLSSLVTFGVSMWRGEPLEIALKKSAVTGLKVGGTAWVSSILAAQLGRTGVEQGLRGATDWMVRQLGAQGSAVLANAMRGGATIHGAAAMSHLSKLLRGNLVTGVAVTVVLSAGDFVSMFRGRVSGAQVFKNVSKTASGVAGGTAGWLGGAAAGAALGSAVPVVGTAAGGIVGGLVGAFGAGWVATEVSGVVLDELIEDDAVEMLAIFETAFSGMATDHLLSQAEAEAVIEAVRDGRGFAKIVGDLYASSKRSVAARSVLRPHVLAQVKQRASVSLPPATQVLKSVVELLDTLGSHSSAGSGSPA